MVEIIRWTCFVMVIGLAVVIGSIISATAEAPDLYIEYPTKDLMVESDTITFYGRVAGTGGASIESVKVDGVEAEGDLIRWKAEVSLDVGENPITVVATDEMGEYNTTTINVHYKAPITSPTQPPIDDGAPSATPKLTVSISITSIPSDAKIYLNDFFRGTTPTRENVTEGDHEIEVIKEGYEIHSETKKILFDKGEPEKWIIELKPLKGSIAVFSTPSEASVYLDDDDMNKTTDCMLKEVAVGLHTIKLTKSGYHDVIRNVSVSVGRTTRLDENLTPCPGYGYIDISSDPSGAKVCLDGNYKGETPKNISKVVVGNHTIKLTKLHYEDVIRNVSVFVGETRYLNEPLTGYGSLRICSYPSRAKVYINDNYTGETPFNNEKVVVGSYPYRLTKSYIYEDVEDVIDVSAGNLTKVHKSLSPKWLLSLLVGVLGTSAGTFTFWALYRHFFPKAAVPQSKSGRRRRVNRALNPKRSEIFSAKSNCGTASKLSNILRRSKKKDFLFSLDPSNREHLEEGDVNDELKKVFEKKKQSLPPGAKVSIIDEKHWEIVDGETQYSVEDKGKRLNIYKRRSN